MFLVMNDKGYGVIKHIQDALQGGRNYYADFQNPALEDVAKLAGMSYAKVGRAEELGDVVAKMVKTSRSEEHTSELQSLMRISYAVFCLKKKKQQNSI